MNKYLLLDVFSEDVFYCTQGYGVNSSYYSQFGLLWHEGIDFGNTNKKIIVRSPVNGRVILDQDDGKGAYGDNVKIWDYDQLCAVQVCHLEYKNLVNLGQEIKAGDPIGEMGTTGNSKGEHVHFNFMQTDANGNRLYNSKTTNYGYLDPQHLLDPNPKKYPPGVPEYEVVWVSKLPESEDSMTHQEFYQKFLEAFRKHKNDVDWGADKDKFEAEGLNDDAMIGRMIDEIARSRQNRIDQISQRDDRIKELEARVKELENSPITPPVDNNFGTETGTKAIFDKNHQLLSYEKTYKPA